MERHPPAAFLAFPRPSRDYTWMIPWWAVLMCVLWVALLVSTIHVGAATPADYQPLSPLQILLGVLYVLWPLLGWAVLSWVVGSLLLLKPLALGTLVKRTGTPPIELGVHYLWISLPLSSPLLLVRGSIPA